MVNGNVVIQGNVAVVGGAWNNATVQTPGLPELVDAQGRKCQVVQVPTQSTRLSNNQFSRHITIIYRPQTGHGAPAQLVYHGTHSLVIPVPFRFRDVALD
jgi:hypothetical protein